ncbi:MAG TPA: 3-ketoacyl-ACP reductase [Pyrinomonadaceae bacterium]|nr:3-ketoacyl-ACP reductase [Pyrinomonadaceae bacterium]
MTSPDPETQRRVALVTGASRGIGRAIAVELARLGCDVMIDYVANQSAAEEAREAARSATPDAARITICQADIANSSDRTRLLETTKSVFGRLDFLVNNAGIASSKRVDLLDATEESFDHLIGVNLKGPYFLTQAVSRWMIEQKNSGIFGDYQPAIINITSVSAFAASPERGDYCVSKAGLAMMTKLFALRLADEGINVYEIRPGVIETDMTANAKEKYDRMIAEGLTPIKRWGTAEDVGQAVGAIVSRKLPFSTGEVINVDGGFHLRRL